MIRLIAAELRHHVPFTALGTASGVLVVLVLFLVGALDEAFRVSGVVFRVLHPLHIVFSAVATTAMYRRYRPGRLWPAVLIGLFGSVGIATLSDSVVPYLGELMMGLPHSAPHVGFIEFGGIVIPAALLGIAIALWRPGTKVSHAGHVLLSTWASLFHVLMALGTSLRLPQLVLIFAFLFLAVWLPCCLSDIVFPLLFTGGEKVVAPPKP